MKNQLNIMTILQRLSLILFVIISCNNIQAQRSLVFTAANPDFRNGMDLYQKEKFVPAQQYFQKAIESIRDLHSEVRIDAEYYAAFCAVEMFHANAEPMLKKFIEDHPETSHLVSAYFNLAKFQFRKRKWEDVIDYLTEIDPLDLNPEERDEYYFKKGYSYFELDEFDKAAKAFYEIKDTDNLYVAAARYYYAHISYQDGKYQTASENFNRLANDPQFGSIVPYYLTQIYYLQGKYEQLLAYAPAVLDSAPPKKEDEIRKLIGDAYYETGRFEEALPNLEEYLKRNSGTNDDFYQLGYSYFQTKNYEQAIKSFQKAVGKNDTLDQYAYFYIGQSNIYGDNKSSAKTAFKNAYQLKVDPEVTEDALFNYAKTAYELSYHPYDDAIGAFEEYINSYPNSTRINDAYEYLVGVYYSTKNYEEALKSIDRIKRQDIKLLRAKQRIAYYRGVELYQEKDYLEAVNKFQLSLKNNYEPKLKASAIFWMAEGFFRLGDYVNAYNYYSDFLASSGARSLDFYNKGYYNAAYTHYERKKYSSAIFWFEEFIENANSINQGLINDAYLRIGDSYFIQKDYRNAIKNYKEAANTSVNNEDYALFQSAVAFGVLGDYKQKSKRLNTLLKEQKESIYYDDALFELGRTELILGREAEALSFYNQLINDYPNSNYLAGTYLKTGLIHYNRKEDDLALAAFDEVIKKYPGSNESKQALGKIKKIYIDKGDANTFQDYINGVPFADISKNELDSTNYVIAENAYLEGKCDKAVRDFSNYMKRYPKGLFSLNAHYYRADCELKGEFYEEAAKDFEFVVAKPQNKFTEKSLLALGGIYRKLEKRDEAITAYTRLENSANRKENVRYAVINLMQLYVEKKDFDKASGYANSVLTGVGLMDENLWQQAKLTLSKTALKNENYDQAIVHLDTLSNAKNTTGAEAKYLMAQAFYLKGEYGKSDTAIYRLVDQVPSFPYWIAKGFILLADNFIAGEDYYNARVTYQSVIDNADNTELVEIAKEKLRILNESQESKQEVKETPLEIKLSEGNENEDKLFEPDSVINKPAKVKEVNDEK
ncbi:tetratricopeptide repeat protein [Vicingaceae bacterium]|nr:tetratricopeptide repeat protein [Vicingaceae bacterium]